MPEKTGDYGADDLAAAVSQIRDDIEADPEQFELIAEDIEPLDQLEKIADQTLSGRRARERGRPKGATNKRNDKVFDYLEACGHRDPATTLSLLQSADTLALAKALKMKPKEVLAEQIKTAAALMPYKYAKKPVELDVKGGNKLPLMILGDLNQQVNVGDDAIRSAGMPIGEVIENKE